MHWKRYEVSKERRPWTPRRIACAARAVQRQADDCPLFPEFRADHSVEARMERMDARSERITSHLRAGRAQMWREARAFLKALHPEDRSRLLADWNKAWMPGDPSYLLSLARMRGISPRSQIL